MRTVASGPICKYRGNSESSPLTLTHVHKTHVYAFYNLLLSQREVISLVSVITTVNTEHKSGLKQGTSLS